MLRCMTKLFFLQKMMFSCCKRVLKKKEKHATQVIDASGSNKLSLIQLDKKI
jgi:hypothetical protein